MSAVHTKKPDTACAAGVIRKMGWSSASRGSSESHDMLGPAGATVSGRLDAAARALGSSPSLSESGTSRFHICEQHGCRSVSNRNSNNKWTVQAENCGGNHQPGVWIPGFLVITVCNQRSWWHCIQSCASTLGAMLDSEEWTLIFLYLCPPNMAKYLLSGSVFRRHVCVGVCVRTDCCDLSMKRHLTKVYDTLSDEAML